MISRLCCPKSRADQPSCPSPQCTAAPRIQSPDYCQGRHSPVICTVPDKNQQHEFCKEGAGANINFLLIALQYPGKPIYLNLNLDGKLETSQHFVFTILCLLITSCTVGINFEIVVKSLRTIFAQKPSAWVAAKHPHNGQIITGRYRP